MMDHASTNPSHAQPLVCAPWPPATPAAAACSATRAATTTTLARTIAATNRLGNASIL